MSERQSLQASCQSGGPCESIPRFDLLANLDRFHTKRGHQIGTDEDFPQQFFGCLGQQL